MQPHDCFRASMAASDFAGGPRLQLGSLVFTDLQVPQEVKALGSLSEKLL